MKESKDYMKHALEMARLTIGQTHPNPSVGAIVVKNGRVVGVGTHMKPGDRMLKYLHYSKQVMRRRTLTYT